MRFLTVLVLIFLMSACDNDTEKKLTDTTKNSNTQETNNNQEKTNSEDTNYAVEKPLTDWVQGEYLPSKNFANICSNPRQNNQYQDLTGDYVDENNWIRSWSHETYLWYNELPDIDPASIKDPIDYFDRMKTSATTSSGLVKDRFHFAVNTAESELLSETGISVGYGANAKQDMTTGKLYVTYIEPNSPAQKANISRGTEILAADGVYIGSVITDEELNNFNSALLPETERESHSFTIRKPNSIFTENIILTSSATTEIPVHLTKTFEANGESIGYLMLNSFNIETAEIQLINAVNQLKSAQISELILDLRYNGGGYLGIAAVLGTMIAGDTASGQVFENSIFNDKHSQYDPIFNELIEPFIFPETTLGFSTTAGIQLPKLNLPRVFIISTNDTASASEALINSLRGIDLGVILIGETTHGKPYGFYGTDNCGTTYYSIQFKGNNAKGFGDYAEGFIPSAIDNGTDHVRGCLVSDDLSSPLGNTNEKMLGTALHYIANDNCPTETMPLRTKHSLLSSVRGEVIRRHPTEVIMLR
jgi:C-terminal processing protease CtpA/Prc